jgi:hypothetical protein
VTWINDDLAPRLMPLRLRRLWASRKQLPRVTRWLWFWGLPFLTVGVGLFVVTGLDAHGRHASGWHLAVDVAVGSRDPFSVHTGFAVALAVASVFVVPAIVGVVAALVVNEQIRRMRRPKEEIVEELQGVKEQLRKLEASVLPESKNQ